MRALRLGDGRRGEAVDAADAFGDAAQDRELVGERQPAGAERRAAESAVIVGVDEARRERPSLRVDHPVGRPGLREANRARRGDDVVFDQDVAEKGRRVSVAGDDARVADELAHHSASSLTSRSSTSAPAARSSGLVYSSMLWLIPPTLGTKIMQAAQTAASICASCPAPLGSRFAA